MIRNITRCRNRDSCGNLFKNLKILPLKSQCMPSLLLFVLNNKIKFKLNSDVCNKNTNTKIILNNLNQPYGNVYILNPSTL
jgi:hypothetical protein